MRRVLAATQASAKRIATATITRGSERVFPRRLFDAIEERLPELGERELRLDLAHVDGGDRLLHAADDRDLVDRDHALLLCGRVVRDERGGDEERRGEEGERRAESGAGHGWILSRSLLLRGCRASRRR